MKIINCSRDVLAPVAVPGSSGEEPGSCGERTTILPGIGTTLRQHLATVSSLMMEVIIVSAEATSMGGNL